LDQPGTEGEDYTARLAQLESARWKKFLDVQRPYRWNLTRLRLGRTLDVGCGIGRNLLNLPHGSLGVDHNPRSVDLARSRGLQALTTGEFLADAADHGPFESMLLAHVLEHMTPEQGVEVVRTYLPHIRDKVVAICPQERGYDSDATHVTFLDASAMREILERAGVRVDRAYSFPLPRAFGRFFTYNETVVVGHKRG
jgi:SAM-dependent methyltransferase